MAGLILRTIRLYLRDNPAVELILVAAIIYIIYVYIAYIISIYICIFVYFYIGQSLKQVNLARIENFHFS